jgi:hypothetical protein
MIARLFAEQRWQVLSPLASAPMGYGIGVNYGAHSKEANVSFLCCMGSIGLLK